ncbi:hypothetical protein R5W23_003961 [Gemmata sp. JC673]|uniref:ABC transporter permease n=1 Tax=Gemmata algarum TaxID=2975278 RepID=A0ABU5F4K4_9BACT|nr:hypothetical protein [Gemmata algarum]MDY3562495.1 hypothetical protein [Gemmata algarum]
MWPFASVGTLAVWELRRLARRGQAMRVRLVLLYALFLTFLGLTAYSFYPLPVHRIFLSRLPPLSLRECAEFASTFALFTLEAQLIAVVAVTPALAASAVAEEKDRQTLPLLLITLMSDREIVFGKAAGRITFVLAAVLAGVPVLMITVLFGGVDVRLLGAGYALTAGTVVLCGAIGVGAACRAPDLRSAVVGAYGRVVVLVCGVFVPPCLLATPFGVLGLASRFRLSDTDFVLLAVGYPLLQVLIGFALLVRAARALRLREATAGPPPVTTYPPPPRPAEPPLIRPEDEVPPDLPPLDPADPVLWKERCVGWRPTWTLPLASKVLRGLAAVLALLCLLGGTWAQVDRLVRGLNTGDASRSRTLSAVEGGWLLMAAGVLAAGRYLLPVAVGVSGAVAGERFRATLDSLLAAPLDRRAVLRSKVQAHAERGSGFVAVAVAAVGMAFIADQGVRVGVAAAVLSASGILFVIALGAWLTVRCAADVRAFRLLLPVALLAAGWPAAVWNAARSELAISQEDLFRGLLAAAAVCVLTAAALWWRAGRDLVRGV